MSGMHVCMICTYQCICMYMYVLLFQFVEVPEFHFQFRCSDLVIPPFHLRMYTNMYMNTYIVHVSSKHACSLKWVKYTQCYAHMHFFSIHRKKKNNSQWPAMHRQVRKQHAPQLWAPMACRLSEKHSLDSTHPAARIKIQNTTTYVP